METLKVLLVDDEEELVAAWVERFSLRGINAVGVTNGKDALQNIKEKDFNVVVLDLRMPGIDGYEILNQINEKKPNLPVILITGQQCLDEEEKGTLANSFDCLVKPVNIEILIEKVNAAVRSIESK